MRIVVKSDGVLVVQLSFWNRLAAARCSDVVLPLALVKLPVRRQPQEAFRICKGLRVGTGIPGGLIAGVNLGPHLQPHTPCRSVFSATACCLLGAPHRGPPPSLAASPLQALSTT